MRSDRGKRRPSNNISKHFDTSIGATIRRWRPAPQTDKGPFLEASERRILLYRLGSEENFCCLLMLGLGIYSYTGHIFENITNYDHITKYHLRRNK
jgi:hypothetical protein